MNRITTKDITECNCTLELEHGLTARVILENDNCMGAPWEECDGHGPVSDWVTRDKRPGELVLNTDRNSKRFYDFAEAVKIAKRDGWDTEPFKTGTAGEQAHRAAMADYNHLLAWCNDQWSYVCIMVTLKDAQGEEVLSDALGGVESGGDYWRECAAEMVNSLAEQYATALETVI